MLAIMLDGTDAAGKEFAVVVQVPTLPGQGQDLLRWGATPGLFTFTGGKAVIVASPSLNRGDMVCIGKLPNGDLRTVAVFNKLFAQFNALPDGFYGSLALNNSGSGEAFASTALAVKAGSFTWKLSVPVAAGVSPSRDDP